MFVRAESGRYNPDGFVRFGYRCDVKYRKKGGCENSPNIKGCELDNFVIEQICNMSTGENAFYDELLNTKNTLQLKSKEVAEEEFAIKKRLAQIEQDIQSQISNLRTAPEAVKSSIYANIEMLTKEQDDKRARLDIILEDERNQDSQIADIEKAKQTIMDFPRLVNLVDHAGKLQLLKRIIECIIVKGDIVHIFLKGTQTDINFLKEQEGTDVHHTNQNSIGYPSCTDSCSACNHDLGKWNNFDIDKYREAVFNRAVIELIYLLQDLPDYLSCTYIEGSACVGSQDGQDILCFQVNTEHEYSQERLQQLLDAYLISGCLTDGDCNNCYNNSACRIYEYLKDFHCLDCFQLE